MVIAIGHGIGISVSILGSHLTFWVLPTQVVHMYQTRFRGRVMDILRVMNQVVKGCNRVKIQQYIIFVIVVLTYQGDPQIVLGLGLDLGQGQEHAGSQHQCVLYRQLMLVVCLLLSQAKTQLQLWIPLLFLIQSMFSNRSHKT